MMSKVEIPPNRPPWIEFVFDNDEMTANPEGTEMIFSVLDPQGIKRLASDEQNQPRPDWLSNILEKGTFSGRKVKNDRDSLYDAARAFDMAQQEFREAIQMGRELISSAELYDFHPTEKIKELFRVVSDEEYASLPEKGTENLSKHPDVLITHTFGFKPRWPPQDRR